MVRQLADDGTPYQKFVVTGLDGVAVHFSRQTGEEIVNHQWGENRVCIMDEDDCTIRPRYQSVPVWSVARFLILSEH